LAGSYIEQTELETKHFKWIWENNAMFPNFKDKAFQTTLNSLNEQTTITIDFMNKEVKLGKDSLKENSENTQLISEIKNAEDIHVHPNIIFNLFLKLLLFSFPLNFALYCIYPPYSL
jgi:hypothetical protein